jgi:transcriptional regulator with XRE-family HTH domain
MTMQVAQTDNRSMYDTKVLAQRLLLSRRDLDLDQEELAARSGVSRPYISQIERGRKTNMTVDVLVSLADALGVNVLYLLGLTDAPLDEETPRTLAEQSEDYVVFEVDNGEQRRLFREIIDEVNALPLATQRMVLALIRTMRQVEQEQARDLLAPRVIGQ